MRAIQPLPREGVNDDQQAHSNLHRQTDGHRWRSGYIAQGQMNIRALSRRNRMAEMVLQYGKDTQLRTLPEKIIRVHEAEIATMRKC